MVAANERQYEQRQPSSLSAPIATDRLVVLRISQDAVTLAHVKEKYQSASGKVEVTFFSLAYTRRADTQSFYCFCPKVTNRDDVAESFRTSLTTPHLLTYSKSRCAHANFKQVMRPYDDG
jgi:hypothetical protein